MLESKFVDLLRHGEPKLSGVYLGRTDASLSSLGEKESQEALQQNSDWELVVCSPLKRCLKSAQWVAEQHNLKLIVLEQLQEYDFGDWDGQSFEAVYAHHAELADGFWENPIDYPPPNGELIPQFIARINWVLAWLLARKEQKILVVTHGGVVRCMLGELLGVKPEHWNRIKVDYSHFTQLKFDYNAEQCWSQLLRSNCKKPL